MHNESLTLSVVIYKPWQTHNCYFLLVATKSSLFELIVAKSFCLIDQSVLYVGHGVSYVDEIEVTGLKLNGELLFRRESVVKLERTIEWIRYLAAYFNLVDSVCS